MENEKTSCVPVSFSAVSMGAFALAGGVAAWGYFGGGAMSIAISTTGVSPFVHFAYGADGDWEHAAAAVEGSMEIYHMASSYVEGIQITGIPVLYQDAVLTGDSGGFVTNCFTAAASAFLRGWGF